ncbi:MAG: hypothetical protein AAF961_12645, partial [Planctomycetota bacterium]
ENEQGAGEQSREGGAEPGGESGAGGNPSQEEGGDSGDPPQELQNPSQQPPNAQNESQSESDSTTDGQEGSGGAGASTAGGSTGGSSSTPPPSGSLGADEANLEYAREQTDLVLNRLEDQLQENRVDADMLRKLGWDRDELSAFVKRWQNLKAQAKAPGEAGRQGRQELDKALKSIGLNPNRKTDFRAVEGPADQLRDVNQDYRGKTPLEWLDRVQGYVKGASASRDQDGE